MGRVSMVGWLAGVAILAGVSGGVAQADPVVLGDGHVDYAARMVGGQLRSQIKDDTRGSVVWRDPAGVVFEVRESARTTIPDDSRLAFVGVPGSATWMIPQVQRPGILWAGWNTEALTAADVAGSVGWTLQAVQGPGTVAIFQTGAFGDPDVLFNSADGLPDSRQVPLGTHAHGNWAFSQPGSYQLTFQMAATRPSGEAISDTQTLDVVVGRVPTDPGRPGAPTTPGAPSSPSGPQAPARTATPTGKSAKLTLRASAARARGRTLTFNARVSRMSRLDVIVKRGLRVVTRAKARTVTGSTRQRATRVLLGRALAPGTTYAVTIRVRTGGKTATRTLRVRATRAR